jgi:hypothetical protein
MTPATPAKTIPSHSAHCSKVGIPPDPPWPGEHDETKIETIRPPPKKLSQNNVPARKLPSTNTNNSTDTIIPLEESIRLHKQQQVLDANTQITLTEDFYDSRSSDEDMPYPDSDSDTIPMNTDKNKKKRKLQNQYALLSDDEDDDSTAASTDSSITSLSVSILHKTSSTNKRKSKKATFTSNCNHEQDEWLSMKQDPLRAAKFLSHPATHRRNTHERRASEKQATKERNSGIDYVTYGASLATRKHKSRSPPIELPQPLKPSKHKTQSTLFPFVKKTKAKTKTKPHQHRQLFADSKFDETDSQWSEPYPPHSTPAPTPDSCLPNTTNTDERNNTINEEKPPTPPTDTTQPCTGNTPPHIPTDTNVTTTAARSQPNTHVTDAMPNTNNNAYARTPHPSDQRTDHPLTTDTWQQTTTNTPQRAPHQTQSSNPINTKIAGTTPTHSPDTLDAPTNITLTKNDKQLTNCTQQTPAATTTPQRPVPTTDPAAHPSQNTTQHHTETTNNTPTNPTNSNTEPPNNVTTPTNQTPAPMEIEPPDDSDSENDEDMGINNSTADSTTSDDDPSDPESSGDDTHTPNNTTYTRQGPARIQRKKDTRERRRLAHTRKQENKHKNQGPTTPPLAHHNSYRLQIRFGAVAKDQAHTVNAMQHVTEFLSHWTMLDEAAELTNLKGDNTHWTYKNREQPTTPTEVKNCIHAFYSKNMAGTLVLNTTIELTSDTDFWTTQKKIADINTYTQKKKIHIHHIPKDMLQEVAVGMITETSSTLRHNRDNICEELRGICGIAEHIPLSVHEYRRKQRYGTPGHNYQVQSTCLALYTDKDHIHTVKELCNNNIQQQTRNRLFLPPNSTIIPCYPTHEIPAEIHERLVIKHNKCLASLMQHSVAGLNWHQAQRKLRVRPESKFATAFPNLTTISAIELMGMIIKKPNNPIHSISKAGDDVVLNFDKQARLSATEFISSFKLHTLSTVLLPDDYNNIFPSPAPLTLQPLSYRGSTPNIPRSQRTTAASTKHADHIRAIAEQEPYTMPANIPQPHLPQKIKNGTISYATATTGRHRRPSHTTHPPSTPHIESIAKKVFLRESKEQPRNDNTLEQRIYEHVNHQIDTLQTTLAEQLAGPLMSTVQKTVNEELLSNNAYATALKEHFAEFDHSKFALLPASWKPELDLQFEQANIRMDNTHDRITEHERTTTATAIQAQNNRSDSTYSKNILKTHDTSITSLQEEITTQNNTVTILESNLEAALTKITALEQQLNKHRTVEFDNNLDDKISELSSLIDAKLKPVILQQEFSTELCYVNYMTGNMNNKIISNHCTSTGQDLPKLGTYAVDVSSYHSARSCLTSPQQTTTNGHPGGQDDGAAQSAPPV